MRRRTLIACFAVTGGTALLSTRSVLAQARTKVARVGFLGFVANRSLLQSFLDSLRERGWEPGDFVIEAR